MSTIVGMFNDHKAAQTTIDRLDGLGLEEGSIHVLTRNELGQTGGIITALVRAIQPGDGAVSQELVRLGLDREEAEFYQDELDDEGILLVVKADGEQGDRAMEIMRGANAAFRDD